MVLRWFLGPVSLCILLSLLDGSRAVLGAPTDKPLEASHSLLDGFASAATALKLFSGVVSVTSRETVFSKAYGSEVIESEAPLQTGAIFPVASNTKLFTAVAVHQLIDRGIIAWEDPVSKYMRPADFNRTVAFCPHVHAADTNSKATNSACDTPSVRQLLAMSSGIIDLASCPRSDWEAEDGYCLQTNRYQYPFNLTDFRHLAEGDASPAFWFSVAGAYDAPLRFRPGSQFDYSNTNFVLAAYLVEVSSGMSYGEYITKYIMKPAELGETIYDTSFGFKGITKGTLQGNGYAVTFIGSDKAENVNAHTSPNQPTELVQGSVKRALALSGEGSGAGGAGAMQSSAADMTRWYQTILTKPHVLNLSTAAVERILTPTTHIRRNTWYGQGIFVMPAAGFPYNISFMYHPGSFWGYRSLMALQMDRQDASNSQILAVLANRAIETEPPEGSGQACQVRDKGLRIGLTVPCADIQSFLLVEMLQLGLGLPGAESLLQSADIQRIVPCHWSSNSLQGVERIYSSSHDSAA
ncbi:hypothetical protein WJX74_009385 [Apatococcus lobatus]|uniref:Beta-lactamase-related domain-containing protein n=1 Tax=Apatococcus lobatus TaxID=904363 RepID=A0AAW1RDU6_9CHLO